MAPVIKRIQTFQGDQPASVLSTIDKEKHEKERVDAEIKTQLLGSKDAQKQRQTELQNQYMEELNMSKKEAKKAAKSRVADEVAGERVENTDVYFEKSEYEKAKSENKEEYKTSYEKYRELGNSRRKAKRLAKAEAGEVEYIKNKKVRNFVEAQEKKFFDENGKFDQEKYKDGLQEWTGDNKLDLSESRAAGSQYQVKAKTVRKAARYANYDVQDDKTAAKRALHVAKTTGIGAAIGAGAGALLGPHMSTKGILKTNETFVSTVIDGTTGKVIDKIVTKRPLEIPVKDSIGAGQGALYGALIGGAAGLGAGLATMHKIKDQGEKDIFNGISAEEVVKEGAKGIDGIGNAKIVNNILNMENLTDEQKVEIFKKHYGENTGKRVTQRELLAAYEEAKILNSRKPDPVEDDEDGIDDDIIIEDCPKTPYQEEKEVEKEIPSVQYKPEKGEYWASIISSKYGIKPGKELTEAVHELKRLHGITNFNQNIQPSVMNLPAELNGHKLNPDAEVKDKTDNFAPAQKYTGQYINPVTKERVPYYFYIDCNGNKSENFNSAAERDEAMNNDNVKKAA